MINLVEQTLDVIHDLTSMSTSGGITEVEWVDVSRWLNYAENIAKGRVSPRGEKIIATDAFASRYYAEIIDGRFELGEPAIWKSEYWYLPAYAFVMSYRQFLSKLGYNVLRIEQNLRRKYGPYTEAVQESSAEYLDYLDVGHGGAAVLWLWYDGVFYSMDSAEVKDHTVMVESLGLATGGDAVDSTLSVSWSGRYDKITDYVSAISPDKWFREDIPKVLLKKLKQEFPDYSKIVLYLDKGYDPPIVIAESKNKNDAQAIVEMALTGNKKEDAYRIFNYVRNVLKWDLSKMKEDISWILDYLDISSLRYIIYLAPEDWKERAWEELLRQNPHNDEFSFMIPHVSPKWAEKVWKELLKRGVKPNQLLFLMHEAPKEWKERAAEQLLIQYPNSEYLGTIITMSISDAVTKKAWERLVEVGPSHIELLDIICYSEDKWVAEQAWKYLLTHGLSDYDFQYLAACAPEPYRSLVKDMLANRDI